MIIILNCVDRRREKERYYPSLKKAAMLSKQGIKCS